MDIGLSLLKEHVPFFARATEGRPLVVVHDGHALDREMRWARIDVEDVLEQARTSRGLERLEQIKYAIIERDGSISIIPDSA
jgi:uncharacterized membrane protein YcaP (DUF421 family)